MIFRRGMATALLCALVVALLPAPSGAQTATRRSRRAATQRTPAARPTPSPTPPIVVPSLGPPRVRVEDDGDEAPPPPRPTPTPAPTPVRPAEPIEDDGEVIRVSSNLVVVPTSVIDAAGNPVQGLTKADFRLAEEGRQQQIAEIGVAEQVPLDIALVFDVSSSTVKNFDFMKQAAAGFLREVMKPSDRAAVFTIGERPSLVQGLSTSEEAARKLTTVPAALKSTGTAFYDTVTAASKYLSENGAGRHRRVVLVLSDGEDNFSNDVRDATIAALDKVNKAEDGRTGGEKLEVVGDRTAGVHRRALQNVMREVQQADAVFYSINPSGPGVRLNVISQRAEYGMQQIAESTGGSSFLPAATEDLPAIFRRIAAELRAQYLLQYYSTSDAPPGRFLKILVTTPARADLKVRARQGYYVQRQK
jgi:Ca-activated chloride channel family protein